MLATVEPSGSEPETEGSLDAAAAAFADVRLSINIADASMRSVVQPAKFSSQPLPRKAVSAQLLDVLREFGADTVFGIPGGAVGALYGALAGRSDFRVVNAKHETGAVFLAMGYAMATGRPGVVITTSGPGITNAITGLASAYYESIPLVILCGEVATSAFGRGALQEGSQAGLDTLAMVRSITKLAKQATRADSGAVLLRDALISATSGRRGPVLLSLPLDVLAGTVAEAAPPCGAMRTAFDISAAGCRRAMELLGAASRPLVLAGAGGRAPASRAALRRLIEATGAAIAVTPKGKGVFPEDHARYLGVFGFGGHQSVIDHLAEGADVIVVCGTDLDDFSTNAWSPLLDATTALIQIDTDAAQLGKNYPIDLGLLGPMDAIIDQMLAGGPVPATHSPPAGGVVTQRVRRSRSGMLTTAEVVLALNDCCPPEAVFTVDMGEHLAVALHYLKVPAAGDFITCLGLGSMGSGVVSAMGYQMGAPSRRVYSICGDGCFLMYGSDLVTAVQHHLPVTIVVINDNRLNMCEHGIRAQYGATTDMTTPVVDFAGIAASMGATGFVVRTRQELVAALARDATDGPVVLDVRIDPSVRLEGNQRVAALCLFTSSGAQAETARP